MMNAAQEDHVPTSEQTQFAVEEPLFEESYVPMNPHQQPSESTWLQKNKWVVIAGGGAVVFVLLIIMLAILSRPTSVVKPTPSPSAAVVPQEMKPFEQEIEALRKELKAADPAIQELPFPAVNLKLTLEEQ